MTPIRCHFCLQFYMHSSVESNAIQFLFFSISNHSDFNLISFCSSALLSVEGCRKGAMMNGKELLQSMNGKSQNARILKILIDDGSITTYDAFIRCGCTRLSARISDLRGMGVGIDSTMETKNGTCYARYSLTEGAE